MTDNQGNNQMLNIIMKAIYFSALAYEDPDDIEHEIKHQNTGFKWIENKETDTQAFICEDEQHTWVSIRGTEFDNFNDWITNLNCSFTDGPWGKVHQGFSDAVASVKAQIFSRLIRNIVSGKKVIFTGHSQGAAVAELMFSARCYRLPTQSQICIPIETPRNMSKEAGQAFGDAHGSDIFHVVNNNDIVCRVPTGLMGYGHVTGINLNYLDEDGNLHHDISWWERFKDRVKGRVYDFGELGTDGIKDHSISEVQKIWENIVANN